MDPKKLRNFLIFTLILVLSIISLFQENDPVSNLRDHLQNEEFDRVIQLSEETLKKPNLTLEEKKEIYQIKGIAEYVLNQKFNCRITFTELIMIDQSIRIDTNIASSNILAFYNSLREELGKH